MQHYFSSSLEKNSRPFPLRLLLLLFFFTLNTFAQLPVFTLNIVKTEETCPGNGTLTFSVSNNDPTATVTYNVYELPDVANAIAVLNSNFLGGLSQGDYRVIATQTLGSETNSQTQDISIVNQTIPLAYTISSTEVTCNNNGTMTVAVFSGTGVLYEIISGPVIHAPQASPIFTGLPAGQYQIRVFDNCGEGWVAAHTLLAAAADINVTPAATDQDELVSCDSITITNTITPGLNAMLNYPITIVYTVFPPGGGTPAVTISTMASGDVSELEIETVIPYYSGQTYTYTLEITDACGKVYNSGNTSISKPFVGEFRKAPAKCGKYFLEIVLSNYKAPLTVNFTTLPTGFDPAIFNTVHPGPFATAPISYGDFMNPVPYGHYTAQVIDACGKSVNIDITLEEIEPTPTVNLTPNRGCDSDKSLVEIAISGFPISTANITAAPTAFATNLPVDVSSLLSPQGTLSIPNVITGNYLIVLIDECGNTYEVPFFVAGLSTQVSGSSRPGCEPGSGSARIRGVFTNIVSASIESAPAAFTQTLPYDVSFNITTSGIFSMNGLPAGNYTFKVKDNCGLYHTKVVPVTAYAVTANTYDITAHCGSFDLNFSHASNGISESFYLQKYNPVTGTWGHPQTNNPYVDGSEPNSVNSYPLVNNATNYNISYLGEFRIIKRFETYENGSIGEYKICIEIIQSFTFTNAIAITDIEKDSCSGQSSDVVVTAQGLAPLTYQITSKNGQPFFIDNGQNNTFANLNPAIYNFRVIDPCNNIANRLTDVALLPSLVEAHQPGNLVLCDGPDDDGKADFDLSMQTPIVLGNQLATDYTVTYHASLADATNDVNPLPLPYHSGNQTVFVRLEYNQRLNCFDTTSFNLIVNPYPKLDMELSAVLCAGKIVTLTADPGFDSYLWSTGASTRSIVVDEPGTYSVEVSQSQFGLTCSAVTAVDVKLSAAATISQIITTDFTNDENVISVALNDGPGHYSYSLDNNHFQESNTFYGLEAGQYTVYIKDENGCETIDQSVFLLTYPRFFTPNNDGYNDFWQIKFADSEPLMKIYIFDRYGKLLTGFDGNSPGWDGKYNGSQMPSTDYWFLVQRPNGKEHRGHFAMKR